VNFKGNPGLFKGDNMEYNSTFMWHLEKCVKYASETESAVKHVVCDFISSFPLVFSCCI
jgi:hypothetical protein